MAKFICHCGHVTNLNGSVHELCLLLDSDVKELKRRMDNGELDGDIMNTFVLQEGFKVDRCERCQRLYRMDFDEHGRMLFHQYRLDEELDEENGSYGVCEALDDTGGQDICLLIPLLYVLRIENEMDSNKYTGETLLTTLEDKGARVVGCDDFSRLLIHDKGNGRPVVKVYVYESSFINEPDENKEPVADASPVID